MDPNSVKKILFVSHSSALTGGGEDDYERLLKYFSKNDNYEVHGLFPFGPREFNFSKYCKTYQTFRAYWFPFNFEKYIDYLKYIYYSVIQILQVKKYFGKYKFDLIVFNVGVLPHLNVYLKLKKYKQVVFIRETIEPEYFRKIIYIMINYCSLLTITVSKTNSSDFIEKTKTKKNVETIYSSVEKINLNSINSEIDTFTEHPNRNLLKLVQIGNISPLKNQELLIKAILRIKNQYHNLLLPIIYFIGDVNVKDDYKKYLDSIITKNDLAKNVIFLGRTNNYDTINILNKMDILIIASRNEGFPLVISEAFQLSKPVISTNNGGVTEIIKDGINGFITGFSDIQMSEAIIRYYNPELLRNNSENARITYNDKFDLNSNLYKIEKYINNIIK